jgi:hypothetical protein
VALQPAAAGLIISAITAPAQELRPGQTQLQWNGWNVSITRLAFTTSVKESYGGPNTVKDSFLLVAPSPTPVASLPADHRQKLTSALQTHLKAVVPSQEQKSVDPGNAPPAATHQDLEGQQQTEQSEALSDLSESGVPDTTPPKPIKLGQSSPVIPSSAPAKALKTPIAPPSDKPDFSTL